MERTGTTQADLGREVGIGQSGVSMLVNGERKPSFDLLVRLCVVTGLDVPGLLRVPGKGGKKRRLTK